MLQTPTLDSIACTTMRDTPQFNDSTSSAHPLFLDPRVSHHPSYMLHRLLSCSLVTHPYIIYSSCRFVTYPLCYDSPAEITIASQLEKHPQSPSRKPVIRRLLNWEYSQNYSWHQINQFQSWSPCIFRRRQLIQTSHSSSTTLLFSFILGFPS